MNTVYVLYNRYLFNKDNLLVGELCSEKIKTNILMKFLSNIVSKFVYTTTKIAVHEKCEVLNDADCQLHTPNEALIYANRAQFVEEKGKVIFMECAGCAVKDLCENFTK